MSLSIPEERLGHISEDGSEYGLQIPQSYLEDCSDVQVGPRLHYHGPVTINQNYLNNAVNENTLSKNETSDTSISNTIKPSAKYDLRSIILMVLFLLVSTETICMIYLLSNNSTSIQTVQPARTPDILTRLIHLEGMLKHVLKDDRNPKTSLPDIIKYKSPAVLQVFLDTGVNLELYYNEYTLVLFSVANDAITCLELLFQKGANLYAKTKDKYGFYAIHIAASEGNLNIVNWLLDHGFPVDFPSNVTSAPALLKAAQRKRENVVRVLLQRGANVNFADKNGNTALHAAAGNGFESMAMDLLLAGADVHARKIDNGDTPLLCAAKKCRTKLIEMLVHRGANIEAKNYEGKTAMDLAYQNNCTSIDKIFKKVK